MSTMSRMATSMVSGKECYPAEGLDTRPNGELQKGNCECVQSLGNVGFA